MKNVKRWVIIQIRIILISLKDLISGRLFKFARKRKSNQTFQYAILHPQKINDSSTLAEKVHNLRLGATRVEKFHIYPNQLFSFWKAVGTPTTQNGFQDSRGIVGGKLELQSGGGLCQLSGLIYQMSLMAGLKIVERHNHSLDIYSEDERFTPLGSDATVVYAYKDLRIINSSDSPISFQFEISDDLITGKLVSEKLIEERELLFERCEEPTFTAVNTHVKSSGNCVAKSLYRKV